MVNATFRFYAGLNAFLAPARRGRDLTCRCAEAATVKHMVEALGVPHTEVELVLVDGQPASFAHLLREGERVAVYPKFEGIDIGPLDRVGQRPAGIPRFVADAHLGGLARLLRMAGFDTVYDNNIDDATVEALALDGERVALTRDRELLKRRGVRYGCYLRAIKPQAQFQELVDRLDLACEAAAFTRCLRCNVPLRPVSKEEVLDQLPPSVRLAHDEFLTCVECHGVFWKGSHWKRMRALLDGLAPPPANPAASRV